MPEPILPQSGVLRRAERVRVTLREDKDTLNNVVCVKDENISLTNCFNCPPASDACVCVCLFPPLLVLSSTSRLADLDDLHRGEALSGGGSVPHPHFIQGHFRHFCTLFSIVQFMDGLPVFGQACVGLLLLQRHKRFILVRRKKNKSLFNLSAFEELKESVLYIFFFFVLTHF